jgi:hypothetical protein
MTPELRFQVQGAEPLKYSASPTLAFKLTVRQAEACVPIHSVVLRCQIRIDPAKRRYADSEAEKLCDLFDKPERWNQTLRSMLWVNTSAIVPPLTESVEVGLLVPCTIDFSIAAAKYFHALEDGEVPLSLLFSGTIFYEADGILRVAQIPWDKETTYRLPVQVWQQMMNHYYPGCAWLSLRRDVFNRLDEFRRRHGLPTWEAAVDRLLPALERSPT